MVLQAPAPAVGVAAAAKEQDQDDDEKQDGEHVGFVPDASEGLNAGCVEETPSPRCGGWHVTGRQAVVSTATRHVTLRREEQQGGIAAW
jgi:hypothetical protein